MDVAKVLGKRISNLRERQGLTQEQLAEASDLSLKHLGLIERGRTNPTLTSLYGISCALNLRLTELFDFEHESIDGSNADDQLANLLKSADNDDLRLIYRLIKAVVK